MNVNTKILLSSFIFNRTIRLPPFTFHGAPDARSFGKSACLIHNYQTLNLHLPMTLILKANFALIVPPEAQQSLNWARILMNEALMDLHCLIGRLRHF